VTPVRDPKLRDDLGDVLDRSFADNTNAWDLAADGGWTRRRPDGEPRNVQRELIDRHAAKAASGAKAETELTTA
jgi:polyphosphate kinase